MHRFFSFILITVVLFLAGCNRQYTYQYLTTHPKVLEQVLIQCRATPISRSSQDINCMTAENARQEVTMLLNEVQASIQGFGQKVMAAQSRLADLKIQYQQQPSPKLHKMLQVQQDYIARLLAICSYVGE